MNYKGLFVGLTTVDIQYFVGEFPQPNQKIKTNKPDVYVGGPASNAAVAFSYLNNKAVLVSAVGENSFASFIHSDFQQTGIEHFDLKQNENFQPVLASVITSKNGERTIFTSHPENVETKMNVAELFRMVQPEILMIDGFYPSFALECAKWAKQNKIPVVMDCGSWKPQYNYLLDFVDVAICSADFFPPNCSNSNDVINFLLTKKIEFSAISRGEKNLLYTANKHLKEIKIKPVEVFDTLGAGDFLHGAFCAYFLTKESFESALKNAADIASFSCTFKGTRTWIKK